MPTWSERWKTAGVNEAGDPKYTRERRGVAVEPPKKKTARKKKT